MDAEVELNGRYQFVPPVEHPRERDLRGCVIAVHALKLTNRALLLPRERRAESVAEQIEAMQTCEGLTEVEREAVAVLALDCIQSQAAVTLTAAEFSESSRESNEAQRNLRERRGDWIESLIADPHYWYGFAKWCTSDRQEPILIY